MAALLLYFFPDVACSRRSDSIARRGRAAVSGERVKLYTGKTGRRGGGGAGARAKILENEKTLGRGQIIR